MNIYLRHTHVCRLAETLDPVHQLPAVVQALIETFDMKDIEMDFGLAALCVEKQSMLTLKSSKKTY